MPELHYRTIEHPEANGRQAQAGDSAWDFRCILEDGTILHLHMGKQGHDAFRGFILHEALDDIADEAAVDL